MKLYSHTTSQSLVFPLIGSAMNLGTGIVRTYMLGLEETIWITIAVRGFEAYTMLRMSGIGL